MPASSRRLRLIGGVRPQMWIAGLLLLCGYVSTTFHLDERLFFSLSTAWHESRLSERSLWLPEYRVRTEAAPVTGVANNLSGLTYDEQRDQLWAVVNNPEELLALDTDGRLLARYRLEGFSDVEGVTYLGDDLLVMAEERNQTLVVVPLPTAAGPLQRADYQAISLSLHAPGNSGFEGVGYDRAGDRLFVVKEHSPRKLYEIRGFKASLSGDFNLEVIDHDAWLRRKNLASDLSSVEYDRSNGHLILLSDEARLILELDGKGKMVSFRSLRGGLAGLKKSVQQGEGLALDERGDLYVVSEPNLFYVFERRD